MHKGRGDKAVTHLPCALAWAMFNSDTELLFPPRVIPSLGELRGTLWKDLVDHVSRQESTALDRLAFVLLMARLSGCSSCNADSFRALRGCTQCARQVVNRYRGSDQDLMILFAEAQEDIEHYLSQM